MITDGMSMFIGNDVSMAHIIGEIRRRPCLLLGKPSSCGGISISVSPIFSGDNRFWYWRKLSLVISMLIEHIVYACLRVIRRRAHGAFYLWHPKVKRWVEHRNGED